MATKKSTKKSVTTKKSTTKRKTSALKRKTAAANAGIDIEKYFALSSMNGGRVTIVNGKVVIIADDGTVIGAKAKTTTKTKKIIKTTTTTTTELVPDDVEQSIIDGGHIENASIHRRWVMAQTFRMLRRNGGWLNALRNMGYDYMWRMLIDECHVIDRMMRNHSDQLAARQRFFTLDVIKSCLDDYAEQLNNSGISSRNSAQIMEAIRQAMGANTYHAMESALITLRGKRVNRYYKKFTMPNCFIDAYKANGAYYTMQNMVMFHDCHVYESGQALDQYASLDAIEQKASEACTHGEGYKLFGMLKQMIADNHFDFYARMREQYANRG